MMIVILRLGLERHFLDRVWPKTSRRGTPITEFSTAWQDSWTDSWIKSAITPTLKEKRLVYLTVGRPGGCGGEPPQAWPLRVLPRSHILAFSITERPQRAPPPPHIPPQTET